MRRKDEPDDEDARGLDFFEELSAEDGPGAGVARRGRSC